VYLDRINVLIGANNAGKSSILKALHLIQEGHLTTLADVRAGSNAAIVEVKLVEATNIPKWSVASDPAECIIQATIVTEDRRSGSFDYTLRVNNSSTNGNFQLSNVEPNHFVVPYLSRRKTGGYVEDVREQYAMTMSLDMTNLAAKLSRVSNPQFPTYEQYARSCKEILGFVVTSTPSQSGQRAGIYLPSQETIPIDQMGDGVPNIVQLLVNLATSKGKIFLMEEPENDLHPHALKALLDLILESAKHNQFVISTHSNIVVSHLCSEPGSRLHRVSSTRGELPTTASINVVGPTPVERLETLTELGYAFSDLGLWDGWLILEESSAEWIIRKYLIPYFVPSMSRVRTVAAGGLGNVAPSFNDLNRLTLFAHLEPAYKSSTWVRVDGDVGGQDLIAKLRKKYPGWRPSAFSTFSQAQFELYYPQHFAQDAQAALSVQDDQDRRIAKRDLLARVTSWLDEDIERGREALAISAKEVIDDLLEMATSLTGQSLTQVKAPAEQ
jgi:predicted ATPase